MLPSAGGVASSDEAALKRKKKLKRGNRGGKKHGGEFREKALQARANRNFEYVLAQTQEQLLLPDPEEEQEQPVDEGRFSKLPRLQTRPPARDGRCRGGRERGLSSAATRKRNATSAEVNRHKFDVTVTQRILHDRDATMRGFNIVEPWLECTRRGADWEKQFMAPSFTPLRGTCSCLCLRSSAALAAAACQQRNTPSASYHDLAVPLPSAKPASRH